MNEKSTIERIEEMLADSRLDNVLVEISRREGFELRQQLQGSPRWSQDVRDITDAVSEEQSRRRVPTVGSSTEIEQLPSIPWLYYVCRRTDIFVGGNHLLLVTYAYGAETPVPIATKFL